MAQFPFNPQQYQVQKALERLPRGWYPVVVESSEISETAKKDGFKLVLNFLVIDGPMKGRKVIKSYNIQNPSEKAVEIAMSEIKTICTCVGIFVPINQSEELHGKPLQILVTEPKDSDYNDVKGYKDINGTDADKIGAGAPVGHVAQPPQGYGQPAPAQQPYPPQQYAGAPPQQQYAQPQAAPAWAPQQAAPQQQQAPSYPPQAAPQAAPAWAPPAQQQQAVPPVAQPQAPAWQPGPPQAAPQAPAWAPQR